MLGLHRYDGAVGFEGGQGEIVATAAGLASTGEPFIVRDLFAGQWIKVGGMPGNSFPMTANNAWARIVHVDPHRIALDHLPPGWADDDGARQRIRVWLGQPIKIGETMTKGHLIRHSSTEPQDFWQLEFEAAHVCEWPPQAPVTEPLRQDDRRMGARRTGLRGRIAIAAAMAGRALLLLSGCKRDQFSGDRHRQRES